MVFSLVGGDSAIQIALVSFALAFMSAMVTKVFLSEEGKAARERLKEIQKDMKKAQKKGEMKKMQKLQGEMMNSMMESFRHQFKPMLITFLPFILVFYWLRDTYGELGPMVTIFGFDLHWLGWYLICILIVSIPLNKLLKNY